MPAQITVRDRGLTRIRKQLAQLNRIRILVGVVGAKARELHPGADGETVGTIARWLNYGTERMLARPYVDRAIATMKGDLGREARDAVRKIVRSRYVDVATVLRPLAQRMLDEVKHEFDTSRQWAEPLAQSTIDRKGHDQPLLDLGVVRDALSYAIVDGDTVLATGGS